MKVCISLVIPKKIQDNFVRGAGIHDFSLKFRIGLYYHPIVYMYLYRFAEHSRFKG